MKPESADSTPTPPERPLDAISLEATSLMPRVYEELRRIAGSMLRGDGHMTLQPTALVHEAFLRVASQSGGAWNDEAHFRAVASIAMRRVLSDHVRARKSQKRGEGQRGITIDLTLVGADAPGSAVELDAALEELETQHPRVANVIILRFFGGLSVEATADRLNLSVSTTESDWRFARAWLKRRLQGHSQ